MKQWYQNKTIWTVLIGLLFVVQSFAQTPVGNNSPQYYQKGTLSISKGIQYADSCAYLEIGTDTSSKGFRLPRVTSTSSIVNPKKGLMVFDLSDNSIKVFDSLSWNSAGGTSLVNGSGLHLNGDTLNLGLDVNTLGTTNEGLLTQDLYLFRGDVPSGTYRYIAIGNSLSMTNISPNFSTAFNMDQNGEIKLTKTNYPSGTFQSLIFNSYTTSGSIQIQDNINQKGIEYVDNYHRNFTFLSLTDKGYVDSMDAITAGLSVPLGAVGQANGIANLDGSGKIPTSELPDAIVGAVNYQGSYSVATNTPALPTASGNKGKYWVVSDSGVYSGNSTLYKSGDWIISNGTIYQKIDNNNAVTSVNGQVGAVTISTVSNLALGTNTSTTQNITNSNGTGFTLPAATTSVPGLMSTIDKTNLNSLVSSSDSISRYTLVTTNATSTTIASVPIQANGIYSIRVRIIGKQGPLDGASFEDQVLMDNNLGSNASILGTTQIYSPMTSSGMSLTNLDYNVSGNNLLVNVTGNTGQTISWKAILTIIKL